MKIAAVIFYVLLLSIFLWMHILFRDANAHVPWIWQLDALAQSFAGMAFFSGFALYYQARSAVLSGVLVLQFFVVGILALAVWLSHAFPDYSRLFAAGHFAAITVFVGWDLWKGHETAKLTKERAK